MHELSTWGESANRGDRSKGGLEGWMRTEKAR